MLAVTSFNTKLYEKYARQLIESLHNLPCKLVVYAEDDLTIPGVEVVRFDDPDLNRFLDAVKEYEASSWQFDVKRFAYKVFAFSDCAKKQDDLVLWLDADVVIDKAIPESFLRGLLDSGSYIGNFDRTCPDAPYTESGFVIVDASMKCNQAFMDAYRNVYLSGKIFDLPQWHDCYALDYVIHKMRNIINPTSLSGALKTELHPIVMSSLGEYLDHRKGPKRKELGFSPERQVVHGNAERRDSGARAE